MIYLLCDEPLARHSRLCGATPNQSAGVWFVPLWPEIMRRIELGDRLIEVS